VLVALAVKFGDTRLIDSVLVDGAVAKPQGGTPDANEAR
jgi:hypothetical protein